MSFEEFIEAVVRIAFIARIKEITRTTKVPRLPALTKVGMSPVKMVGTKNSEAFLTPPESLKYVVRTFCQKLVTSQVLELEHLLMTEKMDILIGKHRDLLDQVFVKYAEAVKSTDDINDNKTIDLKEFNILMKDIIAKNIPITNRVWRVSDSRIFSVIELKQIFYSSQRLNLKSHQQKKIDKQDHALDINEFYGFHVYFPLVH